MASSTSTVDLSIEQWKPVVGYEGYYSVSNLGRVMRSGHITNHRTHVGKIVAQVMSRAGYFRVHLSRDKVKRIRLVHQVVAEAFIGPRPGAMDINHISAVKTDNRACNLEYVTKSQNTQHMMRLGLHNPPRGERAGNARLTEVQVREIKTSLSAGVGLRDLARQFGVHVVTIHSIKSGRSWKHVA